MKVEAELKTMYKITVGDTGMCMGQYYSEDDYEDSYYGDDLKYLAEQLSVMYPNGYPKRRFSFEQVEVLVYDDKQYDHNIIKEYNSYKKDSIELKQEYEEFIQCWNDLDPDRKKMQEIQKSKAERAEKLERIKREEERKNKELAEYLKLKEKFENVK